VFVEHAQFTYPIDAESDSSPAWSPDGKLLAFARNDPATRQSGVFVVKEDGTVLRQLFDSGQPHPALDPPDRLNHYSVGAVAWLPDNKTVAFVAVPDISAQIQGAQSTVWGVQGTEGGDGTLGGVRIGNTTVFNGAPEIDASTAARTGASPTTFASGATEVRRSPPSLLCRMELLSRCWIRSPNGGQRATRGRWRSE
jgi:hypothetical protein